MRVLARTRLSRDTKESTSIERQREIIEAWATANDHTVIGWAEDISVSGGIDPFDTPELGDWLNNRADQFDCVAAWKLDRLGRDSIRLNKLFGWAIDNGITVVSCTEGIDLSTPVGRLIANVIAFLAEGERELIRERTAASQKKLRELGRLSGKVPYGYLKKKLDGGGYVIEPDTETTGPVVKRIITDVLDGKTVESIAATLTAENVPSPSGAAVWRGQTIRKLLRSKTLLAHSTHDGNTVRNETGQPVLKGTPLIDTDTYQQVQAALEGRSFVKKNNRTSKASPLLGVALCFHCEQPLHHRAQTTRTHSKNCVLKGQTTDCGCPPGKLYRYYYCRSCRGTQLKADTVETLLEETFLNELADEPERIPVHIPAENHQQALDEAVRGIDELTALLGTVTSDTVKAKLLQQIAALDQQITALEKLPSRPAGVRWEPTGVTYGQQWEAAQTPDERRALLLRSGITCTVTATPAMTFHLRIPADLRERIHKTG